MNTESTVTRSEACKHYDITIVNNGIVYYDVTARRWYVGDASDLDTLCELMANETPRDAYSHWCSGTNHGEFASEEEAIEAAKLL